MYSIWIIMYYIVDGFSLMLVTPFKCWQLQQLPKLFNWISHMVAKILNSFSVKHQHF